MTGIDILDKVKANPHSQRSPVVTDDQVEIDRCYEGANVYITEPVDYEGFAPAIKSLCQLSKFLPSEFVYS